MHNPKITSLFLFLTILIFRITCAQEDLVIMNDESTITGLIVEEVPFEYIRIQRPDFELKTINFKDIKDIFRPQGIRGYWEVVFMKNGGTIRGFVSIYYPNDFLVLEDERGNEFEWEMVEIHKIVKEPTPDDQMYQRSVRQEKKSVRAAKKANRTSIRFMGGTLMFLEAGGQFATGPTGQLYPGFHGNVIYAWRIENKISIGAGLGLDALYNLQGGNNSGRMAFGDIRYYVSGEKIKPYVSFAGGYDLYRRGWTINPGIGARMKVLKKWNMNLNLSLRVQEENNDSRNPVIIPGIFEIVQFRIVFD